LPRPRGFISFYGPTDLAFGYSAGDEDDILQSRDLLRRYFGGDPWHAPDAYQHGSPLLQAHATFLSQPGQQADLKHGESSRMPTLIFHGKPDSLVWFKHSERLHAELEWQSTPVVFALFDTAPHGFDFNLSSPYGLLSTSSVLDFLSRVVR
jgi:fermentation-respiration switch protein FrsA (DUF1100 family)